VLQTLLYRDQEDVPSLDIVNMSEYLAMRLGTNSCETFRECGYVREETKLPGLIYGLHSRSRSYPVLSPIYVMHVQKA
jgi:hypothetical protein